MCESEKDFVGVRQRNTVCVRKKRENGKREREREKEVDGV